MAAADSRPQTAEWLTDLPTDLLNSADQNALKNILLRCREYLRSHLATLVDHEEERQPLQFLGQFHCRSGRQNSLCHLFFSELRDVDAKGPVNCAALDVESRSSRRRRHPDRVVAVSHIQNMRALPTYAYVQYVCVLLYLPGGAGWWWLAVPLLGGR